MSRDFILFHWDEVRESGSVIDHLRGLSERRKALVHREAWGLGLAMGMEGLVRLGNLIVHGYWEVDDSRVYREAREGGLRVVEEFIREAEAHVRRP